MIKICVNCYDKIQFYNKQWNSTATTPYPCALKNHVPIEDDSYEDTEA